MHGKVADVHLQIRHLKQKGKTLTDKSFCSFFSKYQCHVLEFKSRCVEVVCRQVKSILSLLTELSMWSLYKQ